MAGPKQDSLSLDLGDLRIIVKMCRQLNDLSPAVELTSASRGHLLPP